MRPYRIVLRQQTGMCSVSRIGKDIHGLTDCIMDYIHFCVDNSVPTRKVRCFPNNKPSIKSDLKALLNEKKRAFREGGRDKVKSVHKELKVRIKEEKRDKDGGPAAAGPGERRVERYQEVK